MYVGTVRKALYYLDNDLQIPLHVFEKKHPNKVAYFLVIKIFAYELGDVRWNFHLNSIKGSQIEICSKVVLFFILDAISEVW